MQRRQFLENSLKGALAAGTLAATVAGCRKQGGGGSASLPRVSWNLASSFPRSLDTIFGAAMTLSNRVKEVTQGQFTIAVNAAGEFGPALKVLEFVQQGSVEIGHSAGYYYRGKEDALAFDTALPFGLDARQHLGWLASGGLELLREVYANFNIINLPGGNTGVQMGGWFREPIRSMADMRGLKMRIPGLGGVVMDRLGVSVQNIAGGDIYQSLETGVLDAAEWVGPYDDEKLGFYQVAKHYMYPGWWEPGPALSFYVNKDAWDALPEQYQALLTTCSAEAGMQMLSDYDAKNPIALKSLLEKGVQLHEFPKEVMDAAHRESEKLYAEFAATNPVFRKVFENWDAFRQRSNRWLSTAERSYSQFNYGG